jgi:hypothetical protein
MAALDYLLFDADNHYYETRDCFTRYIEPRYRDKAIRSVVVDGVERIVVGDKPFTFMDPKFDKTNPPGSLYDMVRNVTRETSGPTATRRTTCCRRFRTATRAWR